MTPSAPTSTYIRHTDTHAADFFHHTPRSTSVNIDDATTSIQDWEPARDEEYFELHIRRCPREWGEDLEPDRSELCLVLHEPGYTQSGWIHDPGPPTFTLPWPNGNSDHDNHNSSSKLAPRDLGSFLADYTAACDAVGFQSQEQSERRRDVRALLRWGEQEVLCDYVDGDVDSGSCGGRGASRIEHDASLLTQRENDDTSEMIRCTPWPTMQKCRSDGHDHSWFNKVFNGHPCSTRSSRDGSGGTIHTSLSDSVRSARHAEFSACNSVRQYTTQCSMGSLAIGAAIGAATALGACWILGGAGHTSGNALSRGNF